MARKVGHDHVPFHFQSQRYGPFSFELASALDGLCDEGLLREQFAPTETGNPFLRYELTAQGEDVACVALEGEWSQWEKAVQETVNSFKTLELSSLVEIAQAAAKRDPKLVDPAGQP